MKIFISGGSGDLGVLLARDLHRSGDIPVRMDIRQPVNPRRGIFVLGSILDRIQLAEAMRGCDLVVHIAAWHGIHLVNGEKDAYDFWDLNATGSFNMFEEAARQKIGKFIFISSTSIGDRFGVYGHSKVIGEELAEAYRQRHDMNVLVLRPGAFIPYWNKAVYTSFQGWAQWYWKGAVHILDVLQAVNLGIGFLKKDAGIQLPPLFIDGKYEYTTADLEHWDAQGPGSTFRKYYADYETVARQSGLDISLKPTIFDIEPARTMLSYHPSYSFMNLLQELAEYGVAGPPVPEF